MAESGRARGWAHLAPRSRDAPRLRHHATNNVAKRPLEFFIRLAREQLRPTYGQGFQGAPLQPDTEASRPQTIHAGGSRAKITQPTSEVS